MIVPLFVLFSNTNLLDTHLGFILIFAGMNLPLVVWMVTGFMEDLPFALVEAVRLDGANLRQEFTAVLLPLLGPGLAATSLLALIFTWNEFFFAVSLTTREASPLSVYVSTFKSAYGDLFLAKMSAAATAPLTAAQITAPRKSRILETERPTPAPDELLIEVARAGICGTDVHIWHGDYELARFPLIPGHEFAGAVVAVGENVTRYRVGNRVTADPYVPCLICPEGQRNAFNQCHDLTALGVTTNGAFAHFMVAPERNVFPIGDMSFAAGALIGPLEGMDVAVVGAGTVGVRVRRWPAPAVPRAS